MSSSDRSSPPAGQTRRNFLKAAGGTLAAAATAESLSQPALANAQDGPDPYGVSYTYTEEIEPPDLDELPNPKYGERQEKYGEPGYPPIDAYHEVGRTELRKRKELGPLTFEQTLSPSDIGLSPGGSFSDAIEGASLDNAQLDLQGNTYTMDGKTTIQPSGTFGLKNGTLKVSDGVIMDFVIESSHAEIKHLTIDQTAKNAVLSLKPHTDGSFTVKNIKHSGYAGGSKIRGHDSQYNVSPLKPVVEGNGHLRVEHHRAMGGVQAAAHTQSNSCPNFEAGGGSYCYVGGHGDPNRTGTLDFVNCQSMGFNNAFYCSKTPSTIRVIGGKFINNENATIRISAPPGTTAKKQRSRASGCTIYYNQDEWPNNRPGNPYSIGEIQGLQAMRSESEADAIGPLLDHIDVHGYNIKTNDCGNGGFDGFFKFKDDVGGGILENCRFTGKNIPPTPAIHAYAAGNEDPVKSKYGGTPPQPWGIQMSGIEVVGDFFQDMPAIQIEGNRGPPSSLKDSCIHAAAGPEAISGIPSEKIQNVGYGPNCKKSQGPTGKVGAPGNISDVPMNVSVSGNYSASGNGMSTTQPNQNNWIGKIAAGVMQVMVTLLLFVSALFVLFLTVFRKLLS